MGQRPPTALRKIPGDTPEERRAAVAEINQATGEAREASLIGKGFEESRASIHTINGMVISEEMTWPVVCTLPMYESYTVYFRTNNPTGVYLSRPRLVYSNELHAKEERMNALLRESMEKSKVLTDEFGVLSAEVDSMRTKEYSAYIERRARWLSMFVKRVEPWNFGYISARKEDGTPVVSAYPPLNAANLETYITLINEHEPLATWCENDGYNAALQAASRPFSRVSEKVS